MKEWLIRIWRFPGRAVLRFLNWRIERAPDRYSIGEEMGQTKRVKISKRFFYIDDGRDKQ